jgi:hypothetical protein
MKRLQKIKNTVLESMYKGQGICPGSRLLNGVQNEIE